MKTHLSFGAGASLELTRAILIYEGRDTAVATAHLVHREKNGRATIAPGACVTAEAVQHLASGLSISRSSLALLPPEILCVNLTTMIWHRPPQRRELWFSPHDSSPECRTLRKLSGEIFPHPHLLFMAMPGRSGGSMAVWVFALRDRPGRGEERPTLKSALYRAPYWNLSADGLLCNGSAQLPKTIGPAMMAGIETGFFKSNFTHPNSPKLTLHPQGHAGLWKSLAGKKRAAFPGETLVRMKDVTLETLIRKAGQRQQ